MKTSQFCPRFGEVAIELGYITPEQLKEALTEQTNDDIASKPHRLIGTILFEKGWLTNKQIDIVLEHIFQFKKV